LLELTSLHENELIDVVVPGTATLKLGRCSGAVAASGLVGDSEQAASMAATNTAGMRRRMAIAPVWLDPA
jgi:hypothetical protein